MGRGDLRGGIFRFKKERLQAYGADSWECKVYVSKFVLHKPDINAVMHSAGFQVT